MNLETNINNLNYIKYMEDKGNDNGGLNRVLESERATQKEKQKEKESFS